MCTTYSSDVRLHLGVGQVAQLWLELLEVVNRAAAMRRVNDLLSIARDLPRDRAPRSLDLASPPHQPWCRQEQG